MNQSARPTGGGDFMFSTALVTAGIAAVAFFFWLLGPIFLLIAAVVGLNWLLWGRSMPPKESDESD